MHSISNVSLDLLEHDIVVVIYFIPRICLFLVVYPTSNTCATQCKQWKYECAKDDRKVSKYARQMEDIQCAIIL